MKSSDCLEFSSALQVAAERIKRLSDVELGELMGQLLRAHSYRCRAPLSEVRVNTEEKAADGGADAWSGKPETCDEWFGDEETCWQLKAGSAGSPAALKGEVLKELPRGTLAQGGRFVLVATGSTNGTRGERKRLNTLTTEAEAAGIPTDRIAVIGSERLAEWCNQHPAIAARWANRPDGLWSLSDWQDQEHQAPWQAMEPMLSSLESYRLALDPVIPAVKPCLHLHVHGPPGAGKTRLALEFCSNSPWADFVVYVQRARASNVLSLLNQAANEKGVRFVVVADDTPADLLKPLREVLGLSEGRVRLITLGTSHSPDPRQIHDLQLTGLREESLRRLVACWYPAMEIEHVRKAVSFAAGNPRLARLAADALHECSDHTANSMSVQPPIRKLREAIAAYALSSSGRLRLILPSATWHSKQMRIDPLAPGAFETEQPASEALQLSKTEIFGSLEMIYEILLNSSQLSNKVREVIEKQLDNAVKGSLSSGALEITVRCYLILAEESITRDSKGTASKNEALLILDKCEEICKEISCFTLLCEVLNKRGVIHHNLRRRFLSSKALEESADISRQLNLLPSLSKSLTDLSFTESYSGDPLRGIATADESRQIANSRGDSEAEFNSRLALGAAYLLSGNSNYAIQVLSEGRQLYKYPERDINPMWHVICDILEGLSLAQESEAGHAELLFERALDFSRQEKFAGMCSLAEKMLCLTDKPEKRLRLLQY